MKRKDFLKKFGIGLGVVAVAPTVVSALGKDKKFDWYKDKLPDACLPDNRWHDKLEDAWKDEYENPHWTDSEVQLLKAYPRSTPFSDIVLKGRKAKITDKQLRRFREND